MSTRISLVSGDITELAVDAIVNAANSSLLGGGGVDGAIHRAAGPQLLAACKQLRREQLPAGLPVGQAVSTPGFDLPARWVIHTVGPNRHRGQTDPELLAAVFRNSLQEADRLGATSVAFPAISAGVYGWKMEEVARIGLETARAYPGPASITFCLFNDAALSTWQEVAAAQQN
ncbi:Appr-1-p processing protein [Actinobaculum suis]|uniref:Appr-1-p processing protein n=1 Tax=Actinobaculum suis TaxID=1657 RepID=A0A1B9BEJ4_9ACTO|nr:O-acetyl-ADP-ribose deacetylase [Actinobaculum suis]OCA95698.1 O-acetyl-ADP-ribose deacetylase [Actinobaculum suis]OCA95898.1 O-acetyl-ADP-ribose deacetylase [Actinobaculum suis]VDG76799.1 Appr-1-p processing protein [Actinobaculum suis]